MPLTRTHLVLRLRIPQCAAMPETRSGKKKLLIILGAGSSVDLDMPKVTDLNSLMLRWAAQWAARERQPNFFEKLWEIHREHSEDIPEDGWLAKDWATPNYERCLGSLLDLLNAAQPPPWNTPFGQAFCRAIEIDGKPVEQTSDTSCAIESQYACLVRKLAGHFRDECRKLKTQPPPSFIRYRAFFEKLGHEFEIGIYNLNHDTAALNALPGFATGFDAKGIFRPALVHQRREWDFLYHLHGSVHFTYRNWADQYAKPWIEWSPDLTEECIVVLPNCLKNAELRGDRRVILRSTLIAGGSKLEQIQDEPFQTFYSALPRHASEADAILLAGYSFGDEHINSILANRLAQPDQEQLPVLILDYDPRRDQFPDGAQTDLEKGELACERMLSRRQDSWTYALGRAFYLYAGSFIPSDHLVRNRRSPGDGPLKKEQYEIYPAGADAPCAAAVWFGGFGEATERVDEIVSWLAGEPSSEATPGGH